MKLPAEQNARIAPRDYVLAALQFTLLLGLARIFRIENPGFLKLLVVAWGGFLVHALAPLRFRLWIFCGLSVLAIGVVLGLESGAWVLGLGAVMIGACYLPRKTATAVVAVCALGLLLGLARAGVIETPVPGAAWPVLGSLFIFRMMVYLYDVRTQGRPDSSAWPIAYFFLLPNVCFPLFPIVDFQRFRTGYYSEPCAQTYYRGLDWIRRGLVQLILYRLVYYHFLIAIEDVDSVLSLVHYAVGTYLLYLMISGHFHTIAGMLLLFGFNLPRTNDRYYYAESFTDFWRRINVYWKDFMTKLFFYPAYMRLRKLGDMRALVLASALCFVVTWFFHGYQWFWIRGSFPLLPNDIIFWLILGVLVVLTVAYEQTYGRSRNKSRDLATPYGRAALILRRLTMFSLMCVLWMFWTTDSMEAWLRAWQVKPWAWMLPVLWIPGLFGIAIWARIQHERKMKGQPTPRPTEPSRAFHLYARYSPWLAVVAFCVLGSPQVRTQLPEPVADLVRSGSKGRLNPNDIARLTIGYYEDLVHNSNMALAELYRERPPDWIDFPESALHQKTEDFLQHVIPPSLEIQYKGAPLSVNTHGMRDKEYPLEKPAGSFRVAVLGASPTMGEGVADHETFEALLEERLTETFTASGGPRIELLNFAVSAYDALTQVAVLERKAMDFDPDLVIYVAHSMDREISLRHLTDRVINEEPIPYPDLQGLLDSHDIRPGRSRADNHARITAISDKVLGWAYERIVQGARANGMEAVFAYVPMPLDWKADDVVDQQILVARDTGFIVWELKKIYGDIPPEELCITKWDQHPNARAHRIIADTLFPRLEALLRAEVQDVAVPATDSGSLEPATDRPETRPDA